MKNSKLFEEVPVGTVVYGVHEHWWYAGEGVSYLEFVVSTEEVKSHIAVGYNEVRTSDGSTPYYYSAKDFGKCVFFTAKEAAIEARERTLKYESRSRSGKKPPMRRTWEKYLEEEDENHVS